MPKPIAIALLTLTLAFTGSKNLAAQTPDHSTQIAVIFEELEPLLKELVTCQMSRRFVVPEQHLAKIEAALASVKIAPDQVLAYSNMLRNVKPLFLVLILFGLQTFLRR